MIGTIICRNCDTAIEVSEGDVSKFQVNPVFVCPVCQQNLAQRMADLVGGSPLVNADGGAAAEDFTVPEDEEVYDGLPVGDSFDDAAARLKTARTKLPPDMVTAQPAAAAGAVGGAAAAAAAMPVAPPPEDPTSMALRLAAEAAAHAEKLARGGTNGDGGGRDRDRDDVPTGVMPVLRADGRAAAAPVPAREKLSPSVVARAASADSGVVPDSERAPARGRDPDEPTPVIPSTLGVTPVSPTNEATPALTRRPEPTPSLTPPADVTDDRPVPDPGEVTQRKMGAAPQKLVVNRGTLAPRTGTGPAGIGALGIRVAGTRAVVQPAPSGVSADHAVQAPDSRVSSSHPAVVSVETTSTDARMPSPPAAAPAEPRRRADRRNVPMLAAVAAAGLAALVLLAFGISKLLHPAEEHSLVDAEPTVSLNVAATAAADTPMHLPSTFAPLETPVETPLATTTRLAPPPTAPIATPAPTRAIVTATPIVFHTPAPTRVVIAPTAPAATPKPVDRHAEARALMEQAKKDPSTNAALVTANKAVALDPSEDIVWDAFDLAMHRNNPDMEIFFGKIYVQHYPSSQKAQMIDSTIKGHEKSP